MLLAQTASSDRFYQHTHWRATVLLAVVMVTCAALLTTGSAPAAAGSPARVSEADRVTLADSTARETRRTVATARKVLKVYRRPKAARDVVRPVRRGASRKARAALAALDSRLLARVDDREVFLVPEGSKLCLWERSRVHGYAAAACSDTDGALDPDRPLTLLMLDSPARTMVLMVDGAANARVSDETGTRAVPISNNLLRFNWMPRTDQPPAPDGVTWRKPDGSLGVMSLMGPMPSPDLA